MTGAPESILIIRRDNIGDLVCTTPSIRMLREAFPRAWIGALVTKYNAAVLTGNPDLNAIFSYQKVKHRQPDESALTIYLARIRQILNLRAQRIDTIILPTGGEQASAERLARWIGANRIVRPAKGISTTKRHEVERCAEVLSQLGITGAPPAVLVVPSADSASAFDVLADGCQNKMPLLVAMHISARKPDQRWQAEKFVELASKLHASLNARIVLLWSPGSADNPLHPGDDEKAAQILARLDPGAVKAYPTQTLENLIGALSKCDLVVCSDGGAMHLAAGLGKKIVCFFGSSEPSIWHPWGVPHAVLRSESRRVEDISVDKALENCVRLLS